VLRGAAAVSSVNRRLSVLCAGDERVPGVGREVCHGVHVACGEAGDNSKPSNRSLNGRYYVRLTRLTTHREIRRTIESSCTALDSQYCHSHEPTLSISSKRLPYSHKTDDMHTPFHHGAWLCSPSGLPPARYPLGRAHLPLEAQVRLQIERAECRQARFRTTERCGGRVTLAVRTL
jgi:hypothetical protein